MNVTIYDPLWPKSVIDEIKAIHAVESCKSCEGTSGWGNYLDENFEVCESCYGTGEVQKEETELNAGGLSHKEDATHAITSN